MPKLQSFDRSQDASGFKWRKCGLRDQIPYSSRLYNNPQDISDFKVYFMNNSQNNYSIFYEYQWLDIQIAAIYESNMLGIQNKLKKSYEDIGKTINTQLFYSDSINAQQIPNQQQYSDLISRLTRLQLVQRNWRSQQPSTKQGTHMHKIPAKQHSPTIQLVKAHPCTLRQIVPVIFLQRVQLEEPQQTSCLNSITEGLGRGLIKTG